MLADTAKIEAGSRIRKNLVIIGAGAAGISIAKQFIGKALSIALLEAGGMTWTKETQDPYKGVQQTNAFKSEYAKNYLSTSRQRFFGGGTNCWAGWSVPFDPWDFEQRDYVPNSGWPIAYSDISPWYPKAKEILHIDYQYDPSFKEWLAKYQGKWLLHNERVITHMLHRASIVPRFNTVYRDEILHAPNVDLFLNTSLLEFECTGPKNAIEKVRVSTAEGKVFYIEADHYILATGGIENPRLLLASTKDFPDGLGNQHDLVGRYFMEHLLFYEVADLFLLRAEKSLPTYFRHHHKNTNHTTYSTLCLTGEAQREHGLLNGSYYLRREQKREPDNHSFPHALGRVASTFEDFDLKGVENTEVTYLGGLDCRVEHSPHPDNRVTLLSDQFDAFGIPRTKLAWNVRDIDRESIVRSLDILAREFGRTGKGRMKINFDPNNEDLYCLGGPHHMGTTRMHDDPRHGVVDRNCTVHGIHNLHIAGSSVFTTGGFANPTLNIVALSLRLADHLKQKEGWA